MMTAVPRLHKETSIFGGDSIATGFSETASKSQAVMRTQRIYFRSLNPISSWSMPTAWVTATGDVWNASMSASGWTQKVTPISDGTGESVAKYLYLYTCEQREMADGTMAYTTVLLDDTTTVIDGGNIITGSVTANQIDANSVKTNIVQTTDLAASQIKSGTIDAARINASALAIGSSTLGTVLDGKANGGDIPTKVSQLTNDSSFATTSQVSTAKSEAISTAASDATTKANAAQATAISTAATDATTKANAAAQTATNYLTTITGTSGISVHDTGDTSNYVNIASGVIDLVSGGVSRLKAWVDNTVAKVRVGIESAGHAIFSPDGMEVFTDATTSVASFGSEARVGRANSKHVTTESDGVHFYDGSTEMGSIKPMAANAYPPIWEVTYDSGIWQDGNSGNAITFAHMAEAFESTDNVVGGFTYKSSKWYQLRVPISDVVEVLDDAGVDYSEVMSSSQYNLQMGTIYAYSGALGYDTCDVTVRSSTNTSTAYDLGTLRVPIKQVDLDDGNLIIDANIDTEDVTAKDVQAKSVLAGEIVSDSGHVYNDMQAGTFSGGIAGNFATTWHTIVNASSVAAGGYLNGSLNITKTGYKPLGVIGQTSDMRYVTFIRAYIGSPADGSGTVQWMVYNPTTSAKTPTMQVVVLWAKS